MTIHDEHSKRRLPLAAPSTEPSTEPHERPPARWSRRELLRMAGLAAAALATPGALAACDGGPTPPPDGGPQPDAGPEPFDLPTLGGAPDTAEGRTIAALVDTVMPGRHRDPTGAPGGIDVGAPAFFFDPALPAASFVPLLVALLDSTATELHGIRRFTRLTPEQRDAVVERALRDVPVFAFAVQLAKLAYYASAEAGAHLGYPGANTGYVDDADFSFGRAMAREITTDGNLS
jgi:hypothetical protein